MPELFKGGILEMSTEPLLPAGAVEPWSAYPLNRVAVVLTIVLLIVELLDYLRVFPHLLRCLPRWKGNVELEHSVSLARTRNTVALVAALIFVLTADYFSLVAPSFRLQVSPEWRLVVCAGLLAGMIIVRRLCYLATPMRSRTSEFASTMRHTIYNYLILLVSFMLPSALLLAAIGMDLSAARTVLIAEIAVFYLVHLIRSSQILHSRYGSLATILYLCALEILPVGILIFVCTL